MQICLPRNKSQLIKFENTILHSTSPHAMSCVNDRGLYGQCPLTDLQPGQAGRDVPVPQLARGLLHAGGQAGPQVHPVLLPGDVADERPISGRRE